MNSSPWPRAARLDAIAAAAALDVGLVVEGACAGGEVGAAYVRWPDGHRSVLSFGSGDAAPLVEAAIAAGIPAARYELVASVNGRTVVVQELLPGAPPASVTAPLVEAVLRLHERFAGVLATLDLPAPDLYLTSSGPGFCLHEPLAGYGQRTARLLRWVLAVGAEGAEVSGPDLVHLDFHPGNVLVVGDAITGVVDWDGAGRGDRFFDLVTLRFDLARRAPRLGPLLDERLTADVSPARLRAYWAHMSLRLVDWAIRHQTAADVDLWLDTAERGITRLS